MNDDPGGVGLFVEQGEYFFSPEGFVFAALKRHLQLLQDFQRLATLRRQVGVSHFRQQADQSLDLEE